MNIQKWRKSVYNRFIFHGLSIQQRLPLLVSLMLCIVIVSYGFASYLTARKAALAIGEKRLRDLTAEMVTVFKQSSTGLISAAAALAKQDTIKSFVESGGKTGRKEVSDILLKVRSDKTDSTWTLIEVLDSNRTPMLKSGNPSAEMKVPINVVFSSFINGTDVNKLGNFYAVEGATYYPLIGTVTDNKKTIGYVVAWRSLSASPQALQQLSNMMGTGATLYLGNKDGTLWTNMITPVAAPPLDTQHIDNFLQYTSHGKKVLAAVQSIPGTPWYLLIEFSREIIFATATRFLKWMIVIGFILLFAGVLITWRLSRNIVRPLNQLTAAATAIADGDFTSPLIVNRTDELGKLAQAFSIMSNRIKFMQEDLERLVTERTAQLESANKELEAFSYSVSHDLRAPLRSVNGYAKILEEDYFNVFDDEGKRLLKTVQDNAKKMGVLIDDLLAFSRLGRKEVYKSLVNMNDLTQNVIFELERDLTDKPEIILNELHPVLADHSLMTQVMTNLLSNAIKYSSKKEKPVIKISSEKKGDSIVYAVSDNGTGFDMQYTHKLFGVFQRLHGEDFEGTGVGLAIVQRIIERHNGKIWAEAEPEKGATFYFSLPNMEK